MSGKAKKDMGDITHITAFPCFCTRGTCQAGGKQSRCVNWWARRAIIATAWCPRCGSTTWHVDDKCARCELKKRMKSR